MSGIEADSVLSHTFSRLQIRVDLCSPAPWPALQHMRVMQPAIEERGDGGRVSERRQSLEPLLEMAGFQLSINVRFWVSTEAQSSPSKR